MIGFTFFDPIYKDNKIYAYTPNIARYDDDEVIKGRSLFVNLAAIEDFRNENVKWLSLGLSPYSGDLQSKFPDSKFLRKLFKWSYDYLPQYGFKGLEQAKKHYKGIEEKTYFATKKRGMGLIVELYNTYKINRVF